MATEYIDDDKYIVFKKTDWKEYKAKRGSLIVTGVPDPKRVEDATVIRSQDILAGPIFDMYVDLIAILVKTGAGKAEDLTPVSDYFTRRAAEARDIGYKIPGD